MTNFLYATVNIWLALTLCLSFSPLWSQSNCENIGIIESIDNPCLEPGEFIVATTTQYYVATLSPEVSNFQLRNGQIVRFDINETATSYVESNGCGLIFVQTDFVVTCIEEIRNSGTHETIPNWDEYVAIYNICKGDELELPRIEYLVNCPCSNPPQGPCGPGFSMFSSFSPASTIVDQDSRTVTVAPTETTEYIAFYTSSPCVAVGPGPVEPPGISFKVLVVVNEDPNCYIEASNEITVFNINACSGDLIDIPTTDFPTCDIPPPPTSFIEYYESIGFGTISSPGTINKSGSAILISGDDSRCQKHHYIYRFNINNPVDCGPVDNIVQDFSICRGESIDFTAEVPLFFYADNCDECIYEYENREWEFSGTSLGGTDPEKVTFLDPGTYTYTFQASSSVVCQDYECGSDPSGTEYVTDGPNFTLTYNVEVGLCYKCNQSSGLLYWDECENGNSQWFIENDDGRIFDFGQASSLDFDFENNQRVRFEYDNPDEVNVCPNANLSVRVTCIMNEPTTPSPINCVEPLSEEEIESTFSPFLENLDFGLVVLEHFGPEVGYFYEVKNLCPINTGPMGPGFLPFAGTYFTCDARYICGYGGDIPPPCTPNEFGIALNLTTETTVVYHRPCEYDGFIEEICSGDVFEVSNIINPNPEIPAGPAGDKPNTYNCENPVYSVFPQNGVTQTDDGWLFTPEANERYIVSIDYPSSACAPVSAVYTFEVDNCDQEVNCPEPLSDEEIFNLFVEPRNDVNLVVVEHFGPEVGYFYEVTNLCPFDPNLAPAGVLSYQGTIFTCDGNPLCSYGGDLPLPCNPNPFSINPSLATESNVVHVSECNGGSLRDFFICQGDEVQLFDFAQQNNFLVNSLDCSNPNVTITPTENVQAIANGFIVTPTETTTYDIVVEYANGMCPPKNVSYTVFVDEDCSDNTPDCDDHIGTAFQGTCSGTETLLIQRSDNLSIEIVEFADGIDFSLIGDEEEVRFDFIEIPNAQLNCTFNQLGARLTCIERVNDIIPDDPIFEDYPFLINLIPLPDCEGSFIQKFDQNGFIYFYVFDGVMGSVYLGDTFYCTDTPNVNCKLAYGLTNLVASWGCDDDVDDSCIDPVDDIESFVFSLDLSPEYNDLDPNNVEVTEIFFEGKYFYLLNSNCSNNPSEVIVTCEGVIFCVGNCINNGDFQTVFSNCQDSDLPEIFIDYPWLTNFVDPNNCSDESVLEMSSANGSTFVYVFDGIHMTIYTQNGILHCTDFAGFSCIDFYGLSPTGNFWFCNDLLQINICAGDSAFIPGQAFLPQGPQGPGCTGNRCTQVTSISMSPSEGTTQQGIEGFTVSPQESTLYFISSTATLGGGPAGPNCPTSGCTPQTSTAVYFVNIVFEDCNDPVDDIFFQNPWMTSIVNPGDCQDDNYIQEYFFNSTLFYYFGGEDLGFLYLNDGTLYCTDSPSLDCIIAYGVTSGEVVWSCSDNPQPPQADCSNNQGTLFFEDCDDGTNFFFVETSDGTIYDPYFGDGIDFEITDGQKINFDFVDADFATPCSIAQKAIILTCIEEDNTPNPEQPNCENNTGTLFFEDCDDGTEFFFIETNGAIYDPYFGDGIDFEITDGQAINFDFVDADFATPCSIAEKAIILTCIEAVEDGGTQPPVFEEYPFLNDIIDPNDCEDAGSIQVFDNGNFAFIYVLTQSGGNLYFEDGSFYCADSPSLDCLDAYGLTTPSATWNCSDIPLPTGWLDIVELECMEYGDFDLLFTVFDLFEEDTLYRVFTPEDSPFFFDAVLFPGIELSFIGNANVQDEVTFIVELLEKPEIFDIVTIDLSACATPECPCNTEFDPVTDQFGTQYPNACIAECNGVTEFYDQVFFLCQGETITLFSDQPSFQNCADIPEVETTWDPEIPNCTVTCSFIEVSPSETTAYTSSSVLTSCGQIGGPAGPEGPIGDPVITTFLVNVDSSCGEPDVSFAPIGAKWTYSRFESQIPPPNALNEGFTVVESVGEAIFLGQTVKELQIRAETPFNSFSLDTEYVYQEGDKVYKITDDNEFTLLYDFGAQPGDSWVSLEYDLLFQDEREILITVEGIGTRVLNGIEYRELYVDSGFNQIDTINEKFGGLPYMFLQPFNDGPSQRGLRCYEDPEFGSYNAGLHGGNCEYVEGGLNIDDDVSNRENESNHLFYDKLDLHVYPNPSDGTIQITFSNPNNMENNISIFNTLGNVVHRKTFTEDLETINYRYDFENLPSGIYFIEKKVGNQHEIEKIILR